MEINKTPLKHLFPEGLGEVLSLCFNKLNNEKLIFDVLKIVMLDQIEFIFFVTDLDKGYKLFLQLQIERGEISGLVSRTNYVGSYSAKLKTSCVLKKKFDMMLDLI